MFNSSSQIQLKHELWTISTQSMIQVKGGENPNLEKCSSWLRWNDMYQDISHSISLEPRHWWIMQHDPKSLLAIETMWTGLQHFLFIDALVPARRPSRVVNQKVSHWQWFFKDFHSSPDGGRRCWPILPNPTGNIYYSQHLWENLSKDMSMLWAC